MNNLVQALLGRGQNRPMVNVGQQRMANPELAKALMSQAYSNQPIETPIEGLGRLAQAYSGQRTFDRYLREQQEAQQRAADQAFERQKELAAYKKSLDGDKPPKIETFYDDAGGTYKGIYNPATGEVERIGGVKPPSGTSVEVGDDGTVRFVQGPGAGLTKPNQSKVQEKKLNAEEMRGRLQRIRSATRSEFLTYGGRINNWLTKIQSGIDPSSVSEQGKKELAEFASWKQKAISNVNDYIREISGAAVSAQEAVRLQKALPHPEQDDPVSFDAKLQSVLDDIEAKIAIYEEQMRTGGVEGEQPADAGAPAGTAEDPLGIR